MQTIKANTKKGQALLGQYNNSRAAYLSDVYGRFSTAKARADYLCRERMAHENGGDYRILSASGFVFVCGWRTAEGLRVETAKNSYLVK